MTGKIRLLRRGALVALGGALVLLAACGAFVRYVADDYGVVNSVRQRGLVQHFIYEYQGLSGRFMAAAAQDLAAFLGPWTSRVLPGIVLGALAVSLWRLLSSFGFDKGTAGQVSLSLVIGLVIAAPSADQSLYWTQGMLTYGAPLPIAISLFTIVLGRQQRVGWRGYLLAGVVGFGCAGFSETMTATLTSLLVLALVLDVAGISHVPSRRLLIVATFAVFAGGIVMVLSPGNSGRAHSFTGNHGISAAVNSLTFALFFLTHSLVATPWPVIVAAVGAGLGLIMSSQSLRRSPNTTWIAVAWTAALVGDCASIFPAIWATGAPPPARALISAEFLTLLAGVFSGFVVGMGLRARLSTARLRWWTMGISAIGMVAGIAVLVAIGLDIPAMHRYADAKDQQASTILRAKTNGQPTAFVRGVDTHGLGPLSYSIVEEMAQDPGCWINSKQADYFGVAQISVTSGPRLPDCSHPTIWHLEDSFGGGP